jgi:resuscitation-promoting factor RpfA
MPTPSPTMLGTGFGRSFFAADRWVDRADEPTAQVDTGGHRRRTRGAVAAGLVTVAATAAALLLPITAASADPSATDWFRLRMCESSNNYSINTGNGYYGAYQFDLSTWRSVGGTGYPNQASPTEQDYRALYLYRMRGWQPWTCAGILGLREDADAGSGRVPPPPGSPPTGGAPAWPGTYYTEGMWNSAIGVWQKQMHARGATELQGTGQFGPLTAAVVKQVQAQNGIPQSGRIGPLTWAAAWTGHYSAGSPPGTNAPAWPGTYYVQGMSNSAIAAWQKQMHARGATQLQGTGQFGPVTAAVVQRVQSVNGIPQSGRIGPLTWAAAWTGRY